MNTTEVHKLPASNPADEREALLNPFPKLSIGSMLMITLIAGIYYWAGSGTRANPRELIEGIPNIVNLITRMFPPRFEMTTNVVAFPFGLAVPGLGSAAAVTVPEILPALFETIQIAIIGTTLGIFLSLPFGLLAARNTSPHPLVYQGVRFLLNAMRAVPTLIVALIFVASVGLGPFAGVLALALGEIGVLGKLFAEAIESIDPAQVQAVRATGANQLQTFAYGVIPQALPVLISYSLLIFESNVRSASVLGYVGAGGVGFLLQKYMALFQYPRLLAALMFIVVMVTLFDRISDALRRRLI
jgi:phosphonate transport system permease protein